MQAVKMNSFVRQWISFRMIFQLLMAKISTASENFGYLFFHLTIYGRKPGYIELAVDDIAADGKVRVITIDEYRNRKIEEINFRIYNRWLVRNRRKCSNSLLWQIKTAAELQGIKINGVIWGGLPHHRVELHPFDLSRLPSEDVIAHRQAQLKKFQDWMGRWFPSRQPNSGLTERDAANDIIFR